MNYMMPKSKAFISSRSIDNEMERRPDSAMLSAPTALVKFIKSSK